MRLTKRGTTHTQSVQKLPKLIHYVVDATKEARQVAEECGNYQLCQVDGGRTLLVKGKVAHLYGAKADAVADPETIPANSLALVIPAVPIAPQKWHLLVSYNPELLEAGAQVSCSSVVRPGVTGGVQLIVRTAAGRPVNLDELCHVFELQLLV